MVLIGAVKMEKERRLFVRFSMSGVVVLQLDPKNRI